MKEGGGGVQTLLPTPPPLAQAGPSCRGGGGGLGSGCGCAALGRATYHVARGTLQEMAELHNGMKA